MTHPKTRNPDTQDPSQRVSQVFDELDLESLSYVQLRRLHAALLVAADRVTGETESRADDDSGGDTVRVPVPPKP